MDFNVTVADVVGSGGVPGTVEECNAAIVKALALCPKGQRAEWLLLGLAMVCLAVGWLQYRKGGDGEGMLMASGVFLLFLAGAMLL